MFSDIYKIKESENGMMIEVEGKVRLLSEPNMIFFINSGKWPINRLTMMNLRTPLKVTTNETKLYTAL